MKDQSRPGISPLGLALGRIPSGLFILTVRKGDRATGMLASWVQQAGFDPPMLTVALGVQREAANWVAESRSFTLSQLPVGSRSIIRHFGRGFPADAPAFEGLKLRDVPSASPVIEGAISYLDAELVGELSVGDHRIFLASVVAGAVLDSQAEPLLHVRHNGFRY
jgi:flavin reductase (DIM6/NTAB) family NADH-FMN oxidoreductase RutF